MNDNLWNMQVMLVIGCLFIHGFTGAPDEIEPLADHLKRRADWEIRTVTLPGHGETETLKGIRYQSWVAAAEEELKLLVKSCDTVYLVGFSMGGVIAGHLTTKYPVTKLVLLSTAVYYINPKQMLKDLKKMAADFLKGELKHNTLFKHYRKKIQETPFRATVEFQKLVRELKPSFQHIHIPTLIVQGERDGVVPVKSANYLYNTIPASEKTLVFLPHSSHHICQGEDQDELLKTVESFLAEKPAEVEHVTS